MKVMAQGEWYVEANAVIIKKSTMTTYYNKAIMHYRARTPSKMDCNQCEAAGALSCVMTSLATTVSTFLRGPLCANVTSSIKPEVHNISRRR